MPNLRSMRVDETGVEMVASDGRVFSLATAQMKVAFDLQTGSAATKKTKAVAWFKNQVQTALGEEQVPAVAVTGFDFNTADGRVLKLEVSDVAV